MVIPLPNPFEYCHRAFETTAFHKILRWKSQRTHSTKAVMVNHFRHKLVLYAGKTLLHFEIGNGSNFHGLRRHVKIYVGVIIRNPVLRLFERGIGTHQQVRDVLANPYDAREFFRFRSAFDISFDIGPKSSTFCRRHIDVPLTCYASCLTRPGVVITAEGGVACARRRNTSAARSFGAGAPAAVETPDSRHRWPGASRSAPWPNVAPVTVAATIKSDRETFRIARGKSAYAPIH